MRWFSLVLMAMLGIAPQVSAQSRSAPLQEPPASVLARARDVMGLARIGESVIHYRAVAAAEQNYQSDRTYPPFFSAMQVKETWFDPRSGVERIITQTTFPGGGPPAQITLTDAKRAFGLAKDQLRALPRSSIQSRYLSPWTVISDWMAAGDARIAGREQYRDYQRIVIARTTSDGELRLFIDPKTGFPVKLDLQEKHYLWGQRHIEYVYTNWTQSGGVMAPGSSFLLADGKTEISETIGEVEIVPVSIAPSLSLSALTKR